MRFQSLCKGKQVIYCRTKSDLMMAPEQNSASFRIRRSIEWTFVLIVFNLHILWFSTFILFDWKGKSWLETTLRRSWLRHLSREAFNDYKTDMRFSIGKAGEVVCNFFCLSHWKGHCQQPSFIHFSKPCSVVGFSRKVGLFTKSKSRSDKNMYAEIMSVLLFQKLQSYISTRTSPYCSSRIWSS